MGSPAPSLRQPVLGRAAGGRLRSRLKATFTAVGFLLPALVLLAIFRLLPVGVVIVDSLQDSASRWVGLENYRFLWESDAFRDSMVTTLRFNVIINPLQILLAFAMSLLIVDGARKPGIWQTLNLLPVMVPLAVSSVFWGVALRPDDGVVNALLAAMGAPDQPWLTSAGQALWSMVIIASWVGVGYWSIFLVAGLHQIPSAVTEAAAIDGAGYWRTLWSIRLPLMRRPLAFVLVADTVVNLLLFAPVQILTRGGPEGSTNVVMFDVFRNAFIFGDLPLAAAETVMLLALLMVIVGFQFALLRQPGEER